MEGPKKEKLPLSGMTESNLLNIVKRELDALVEGGLIEETQRPKLYVKVKKELDEMRGANSGLLTEEDTKSLVKMIAGVK